MRYLVAHLVLIIGLMLAGVASVQPCVTIEEAAASLSEVPAPDQHHCLIGPCQDQHLLRISTTKIADAKLKPKAVLLNGPELARTPDPARQRLHATAMISRTVDASATSSLAALSTIVIRT